MSGQEEGPRRLRRRLYGPTGNKFTKSRAACKDRQGQVIMSLVLLKRASNGEPSELRFLGMNLHCDLGQTQGGGQGEVKGGAIGVLTDYRQ